MYPDCFRRMEQVYRNLFLEDRVKFIIIQGIRGVLERSEDTKV